MANTDSRAVLSAWALPGIGEITAGTPLEDAILAAVDRLAEEHPETALQDGDIVVITSKVVSKAEGRVIPAEQVAEYVKREAVREVARRGRADGETIIVENHLGIVAAAAGIDQSNTPEGVALLLPEDPDASARRLLDALRARSAARVGVLITDTLGRAWRIGQTDAAIGAAGVKVLNDLRGQDDHGGRPLSSTIIAVADEIAALADLVKGKSEGTPVAVVRGLGAFVTDTPDAPGARSIVRPAEEDMFRLGTDEAYQAGFEAGFIQGVRESGQNRSSVD